MRRSTAILSFLALALLILPAAVGQTKKADPARAPLERAGKAFADAYARGDFAGVARMYSEDAIAFPPESDMVRGRPAIEALWKHASETGVKTLEFEIVDVTSSGNLAAETGNAILHVKGVAGAPEALVKVKYVVVWRKEGGVWRLYRDIWNSLPTGAAPMAATPAATMPHH